MDSYFLPMVVTIIVTKVRITQNSNKNNKHKQPKVLGAQLSPHLSYSESRFLFPFSFFENVFEVVEKDLDYVVLLDAVDGDVMGLLSWGPEECWAKYNG